MVIQKRPDAGLYKEKYVIKLGFVFFLGIRSYIISKMKMLKLSVPQGNLLAR